MQSDIQRIALGTVQLGLPYGIANKSGRPGLREAKNIVNCAREYGLDLLDTASAYGESEKVLGSVGTSGFRLVSKWMNNPERELKQSFENLKTQKLYAWIAHRPEELSSQPEHWSAMQRLQEEGLVERIGFSVYEPGELERLLDRGIEPSVIQFPFNALDHRFAAYLKPLRKLGCEIHCRSLYLQGLFFMDPDALDEFFAPLKDWLRELRRNTGNKKNLMAALIREVLSFEEIDRVVIGVEHNNQLKELIEALQQENQVELPELPEVPNYILNPSQWPEK